MNFDSLMEQLAGGHLAHTTAPPDGLLDARHHHTAIHDVGLECAAIKVTDTGSIGRITAALMKAAENELGLAIIFAFTLRIVSELGMSPMEVVLELRKPERHDATRRELSAVAVDITPEGEVRPRFHELSVFTDPVRISDLHKLGFMLRQFPPRDPTDVLTSSTPLGDADFEIVDPADVEWDGERDIYEGFEEWIDWITQVTDEGDHDDE